MFSECFCIFSFISFSIPLVADRPTCAVGAADAFRWGGTFHLSERSELCNAPQLEAGCKHARHPEGIRRQRCAGTGSRRASAARGMQEQAPGGHPPPEVSGACTQRPRNVGTAEGWECEPSPAGPPQHLQAAGQAAPARSDRHCMPSKSGTG